MTDQKGKLVLYSGSSGVGKGTILKKLMELDENVCLSVSDTTREPREGEIDGVHYNFVTRDNFKEKIASGGYLEYAEYCHNFYGTPMKKYPDILSIFVLPPNFETLERRLRSRGTEDEATIERRLEKAKEEIGCRSRYTYNVINNDLDTAVKEVYDIIHAQ